MRRTALLLGGVLAGALAAEGALRVWAACGWRVTSPRDGRRIEDMGQLFEASTHPELGVELRRGMDVVFKGARLRTNAQGLRADEDWSTAKRPGSFRIVGIGDSVMMGWGVGQDEDYLSRLRPLLELRLHRPVETLNFAVPGYNTVQEYYMLRDRALAYRPDLVVLGYVGNDLEPAGFWRTPMTVATPSFLVNLAARELLVLSGRLKRDEAYDWRPPEEVGAPRPRDFEDALADIGALLRERGIPWVAVLDSRYQAPRLRHAQVARLARQAGAADVVDLFSLYRAIPKTWDVKRETTARDEHNLKYILAGDSHPNALWHERTARELAPVLAKLAAQ